MVGSTSLRRSVRSVARTISKRKTTTGLAEPIRASALARSGGAAESRTRTSQVADSASTSPRKKKKRKIKSHGCQTQQKNQEQKKIEEIRKRKKIPIFVGGTGLYFKALTDGLVKIPNIPLKVRSKIRNLQKKLGQKKFYSKLLKLDKNIKGKIVETDVQRSIRAYEVKYHTKKSLYDWFKNTKSKFLEDDFLKIYIDYPRQDLIQRIAKRTDQMMKTGAIKEVKKFLKIKIKRENSSNKVIGITEIREFLEEKLNLDQVKEKITIKTRQYAKRQSTWARGQMMNWKKLEPQDLKKFLKNI